MATVLIERKIKMAFFDDVNIRVNGKQSLLKFTQTLEIFYLKTKRVIILIFNCILLFSF